MGQNPRSAGRRHHEHSNFRSRVRTGSEDDLLTLLGKLSEPAFLLVLDEVQDPHNLGACLRSAAAAGVHAVVVPKDRSVSLTDTVRRIACGAADHVPFHQVTNLARTLDQLRKLGIWIAGASGSASNSIFEANFTGPLALVMGSEGSGLRRLTAEKCDLLVRIPMTDRVESLNVSVAAGICLFEAVRQRSRKP
ncbi:23S rRNA (guanosine(2251)-2'-O)-methyltransferase RlmB [candidate division GN15 bacterium]|uniref:23S rRNA (Guanosine(2251)-2'-O)-methyltransferase RlmB n=1 Tax=candidate division GN15 bacterium TaxID=2072418 RepID=A0A855XAG1_9BACT|nr:MAG: 23S rRNA (guanosine(2251)-2'-O)-methyltransferase RlmB [candidate division GN15 bacterium]